MVDIESHRVIDLIESRDFSEVRLWLESYPNLQVISRDGSITYKNAITVAHPNAIQVSDRFHILKNLTSYCKEYLMNYFKVKVIIEENETNVTSDINPDEVISNKVLTLKAKMDKATLLLDDGMLRSHVCKELNMDSRVLNKLLLMTETERTDYLKSTKDKRHAAKVSKKMELVDMVREMFGRLHSMRALQKEFGLSRQTIKKYLDPNFTAIHKSYNSSRHSILEPFTKVIDDLIFKGHTSVSILKVIREKGYTGSDSSLRRYCSKIKKAAIANQPISTKKVKTINRKYLLKLLYNPVDKIKELNLEDMEKVYQRYPMYKRIINLVHSFRIMMRNKVVTELNSWMIEAKELNNSYIDSFINGLTRDLDAVRNAITFDYNNGLAEGSVNKLKVIKRIMYGRNSFELLRKKLLRLEKRRKIN